MLDTVTGQTAQLAGQGTNAPTGQHRLTATERATVAEEAHPLRWAVVLGTLGHAARASNLERE